MSCALKKRSDDSRSKQGNAMFGFLAREISWSGEPLEIESSADDFVLPFVQTENRAVGEDGQIGISARSLLECFVDGPCLTIISAEFDREIFSFPTTVGNRIALRIGGACMRIRKQ